MSLPSASRPLLVGLALEPMNQIVSPASRRALARAASLAKPTGARLELLHSVPGDVFVEGEGPEDLRFSYHLSESGRFALLECLREVQDRGRSAELLFRPERPIEALVERARQTKAAMILVGAFECSEGGLGSVTRRLLEQAPCPVWAVHRQEPEQINQVRVAPGADARTSHMARSIARLLSAQVVHEEPADLVVGRDSGCADHACSSLVVEPGHPHVLGGVG